MTLRDLKTYLVEHKQSTLTDLSHHFRSEPEQVKMMLEHWIRKGKVQHIKVDACHKGCCSGGTDLDVYRWTEHGFIAITPPTCH